MATPETVFYSIARNAAACFFGAIFRQETYGASRIPKSGPVIIASNHVSLFDPPMIGYPVFRPLFFLARRSLFESPLASWLFLKLNGIPVDREGADTGAIKRALAVLRRGDSLLLFPEGTRTRDGSLGSAKPGVGLIACRKAVPVVPVRVFGAYQAWGRHTRYPRFHHDLTVVFGHPIYPAQYDPGKGHENRYQIASDRIMDAIRNLAIPVEPAT